MNSSDFARRLAAAVLACASFAAAAEELGVIGPVYPIGEESAIDTIMRRLKDKERTGELKRIQQEAVRRSVNSAKNPRPVEGLTTVQTRAQRLIDPTVTYDKAITTDEGQIVVPAGAGRQVTTDLQWACQSPVTQWA